MLALGVRVYSVRCTEALEAAGGLYFWAGTWVVVGLIWAFLMCKWTWTGLFGFIYLFFNFGF